MGGMVATHMSGIRAEFVFDSPSGCPVAAASDGFDEPVTGVSWTGGDEQTVTEQFTAPGHCDAADAEAVFDYGSRQVYEFDRDREQSCICEFIEDAVGPVTEAYARDGSLHVTIHAGEMAVIRELVGDLNEEFGDVRIEYLVRGKTDGDESELVPVDLRRLTDRQREVLETAHEMGYFEYPRGANAGEVAEALDIGPSTFIEHLNAAQSKLLDELALAA
jgi:predicted DNA binding protein